MALWKPFRGSRANLDAVDKHDGYVYFCIDDGGLFFDYTDANGALQRKQITVQEAEKLLTPMNVTVGKKTVSVDGSNDVSFPLYEIMGSIETPSSGNSNKGKWVKFANINLPSAWNVCSGILNFTKTEGTYGAEGILSFYFRNGSSTSVTDISLSWISLKNESWAESVAAVQVSNGSFDLYYQPVKDYETVFVTAINIYNPSRLIFGTGGYIGTITAAEVSTVCSYAKSANSAAMLQTYKPGSTTETYGEQHPLMAQWEDSDTLRLYSEDSVVKVDYANDAGKASKDADGNIIASTYATQTALNSLDAVVQSKAESTHNHDANYDTLGAANTALTSAKSYTDTKISSLASTAVVDNKISAHNTSTSAHSDIRTLITNLTTKLNNFLDVDDTTTDQLSEVLTLINNNKGTLESLTTSKVNVSDIVNNLTTNTSSKVLSAAQGVAIKSLISALQTELDSHTHTISDVTGLQGALDGKANTSHGTHVSYSTTAPVMDGTASVGDASTVARSNHRHPTDTSRASQTDLDALQTTVAGKANTSHSHPISDVTNLQSSLDGKANSSHTHSQYAALAGATFTGPVKFCEEESACINYDEAIYINNSDGSTLLGANDSTAWVGTPSTALIMRGVATRPTYNGSNLALQSDVITTAYIVSESEPSVNDNPGKFWINTANGNAMYFNNGSAWVILPAVWS